MLKLQSHGEGANAWVKIKQCPDPAGRLRRTSLTSRNNLSILHSSWGELLQAQDELVPD